MATKKKEKAAEAAEAVQPQSEAAPIPSSDKTPTSALGSKSQAPDPVSAHSHVINKLTGSCKICGRRPD